MQIMRSGDVVVVTSVGELDMATAPALAATLDSQLRTGVSSVVLDLTDTEFLGSAGIGIIVEFSQRATANEPAVGLQVVAGTQRAVRRPWDAMNLHSVIPLFPTIDAALPSCMEQTPVRAKSCRLFRSGSTPASPMSSRRSNDNQNLAERDEPRRGGSIARDG